MTCSQIEPFFVRKAKTFPYQHDLKFKLGYAESRSVCFPLLHSILTKTIPSDNECNLTINWNCRGRIFDLCFPDSVTLYDQNNVVATIWLTASGGVEKEALDDIHNDKLEATCGSESSMTLVGDPALASRGVFLAKLQRDSVNTAA